MNFDWNVSDSYTDTPPADPDRFNDDTEIWDNVFLFSMDNTHASPRYPNPMPSPNTSIDDDMSAEPASSEDHQVKENRTKKNLRSYPSPSPDFQPPKLAIGKSTVGEKSKKRKEQNRIAQRAYRERKEKYIQGLLKHVEDVKNSHTNLSIAYETLRRDATRLQAQVADLKERLEFFSKAQIVVVKPS